MFENKDHFVDHSDLLTRVKYHFIGTNFCDKKLSRARKISAKYSNLLILTIFVFLYF